MGLYPHQAGAEATNPVFEPPTAKILLLGTFHFKDAGLDSYKPAFDVDILSEERQQQVVDLVARLQEFAPTKIAVEALPERQAALDRDLGAYLEGAFDVGDDDEYPGVDATTAWYNRNLRIFANLQRITEQSDERILLVIGAGHVPILRHAVLAHPSYELIEVRERLE